jgi:hypothetical protein
MALSPQLLQFKSSGVYRLEFDKSQTTNFATETIRLVVGHSKKGPYNTPVLIESTEDFNAIFGGIDRNLEKKGIFFHRSAFAALTRGPILALNLATFEASDEISYVAPVTNGSSHTATADSGSDEYTKFFDTDKFWYPSDAAVISTIGTDNNRMINFINIKQEPITIFVRKAQDVATFEVTAREWYGEGNVPAFLNDKDYLSDFMVDVFVFKGEFDAATLATDPVYKNYFNADGLLKDQLAAFSNLRQVSLIAQYTGSLIPNFKDLEGRNLYVETMINAEARRTGLFCAVDEDNVQEETGTNVDLVGHVFDKDQNYDLLSYKVNQNLSPASGTTVSLGLGHVEQAVTSLISVPVLTASGITASGSILKIHSTTDLSGDFITSKYLKTGASTWGIITGSTYVNGAEPYTQVTITGTVHAVSYTSLVQGNNIPYGTFHPAVTEVGTGANANKLYAHHADLTTGGPTVSIAVGTFIEAQATGEYVEVTGVSYDPSVGVDVTTITCDGPVKTTLGGLTSFKKYAITTKRVISYTGIELNTLGNGNVVGLYENLGGGIFTFTYASGISTVTLKKGMYVPSTTSGRLAKIKSVSKASVGGNTVVTVTCDSEVPNTFGGKYIVSFEEATDVYVPFILSKALIGDKSIADCLLALSGTNLFDALADKDLILYRYIVDTFGSYDTVEGLQNKRELSYLAHERQNVAAILNAPTIADFKKSTNPSFTDGTGAFDAIYLKDGGNLDKNPTAFYTLPSINDGANYGFYYGPGLLIRENGKDIVVPPAAYVSNNYIDKYSTALPWSIIAGPRRGVVSGTGVVGVEYAFDKNDRDIIEPFGINPIVFQRGVGLTILGNKTGQQSVKSALSSAHVREVLIHIQEGLANILKGYVFEFNTAQTRLEIKTLADAFMESVKADQGVYDFKNVIDQSNNTNEVIDNNIGILDTFVEPVKGLEIVVHRTTVLNTGEIQTGNFS